MKNNFYNMMIILLILIFLFSTEYIHPQNNLPRQITDVIPKNLTLVSGNSYSKRNFLQTGIITLNIKNEYECAGNSDTQGNIFIHYSFYDPKREDILKALKEQKAYQRHLKELKEKSEYSWEYKSDSLSKKSKLQEISYTNGKGYYYQATVKCKNEKNKNIEVITINTLRGDDEKFFSISINAALPFAKAKKIIDDLYFKLSAVDLHKK
jgi:hypothetical protein